ncbi:hypothetical protein R1flu_013374 [Riccia fluitans]|uniref:3'-5' exonuclease domain-containing protein n=1 Tax=Riccia fluitans TaxID=41844 RepID=A0ABD1YDD4_9MARC
MLCSSQQRSSESESEARGSSAIILASISMDLAGVRPEDKRSTDSAFTHIPESIRKRLYEIKLEVQTRSEVEEQKPKAAPFTHTRNVRCALGFGPTEVVCTVTNEGKVVEKWIEGQSDQTTFGLDIEWKPNLVKDDNNRVALLQISSPTDCLLVQLLYLDYIPDSLRDFLKSGANSFGGVGITEDGMKLIRDYELICSGLVELQPYAGNVSTRRISLRNLVQVVFNVTLKKNKKITMSNWAQQRLSPQQVEYACTDAWISYSLYAELKSNPDKRLAVKDFVPTPSHRNSACRSNRRNW